MRDKVNIETIPMHMRGDETRRNQNIDDEQALCKRCGGTGNQMYSMYQECEACGGDGISKNNEDTFKD